MKLYIDSEKLIAEIEERMEARDDTRNADEGYYPESDFGIRDKEDNEILSIIDSLQQEEVGVWIKIDADHPLPYYQEVIGYNKEWVNDQDCYTTCHEEGDDYTLSEMLPDGTRKTWCKYEHGNAVEGYLPNIPTHFMLIPETPDDFTWS